MSIEVQESLNARSKFSTLFILGLGHSGSTLLGRMLGCHPDAVYMGEMLRLEKALKTPEDLCSCGTRVAECPVWQRRLALLPESVKTDCQHWDLELIERLRKAEQKAVFVDSSKSRVVRLKSKWNGPQAGYILLVRDPRGALRSALQKGVSFQKVLKTSEKWMRRYLDFIRQNSSVCLTIFYEDLIASTEIEMRRLCEFAGLDYNEEMCHPDRKLLHTIGASRSTYLKGNDRLSVDLRWQSTMSPQQIEAIAGCFARLPIYRDRYGLKAATPAASFGNWLASRLKKKTK